VTYQQLDLFAEAGPRPETAAPAPARPPLAAAELDDGALVAAIPNASLSDCRALAAEAGRRRLALAVPALDSLCRRFHGFGLERAIPEQTAALAALAAIGGSAAATAVARLIVERVVQGPGLGAGLAAGAELGIGLPGEQVMWLLRDGTPEIRAAACRCARSSPAVVAGLIERLADLDRNVAREAALALGHMGRGEAHPSLLRQLREAPSAAVIDAVAAVADDECLVLLGRLARTRFELREAALAALDSAASPRAAAIAAAIRLSPGR
jgi:hypothetical protein